ncbi:hypothetical protein THERMOT_1344 [Bathymodiolus thermophilus thioautotrophic gill symbiont]|nr:hypothetical protein THERMOT_1344 [Bathymodiolus thermophilus thioautotrophic gill symbiont]
MISLNFVIAELRLSLKNFRVVKKVDFDGYLYKNIISILYSDNLL